MNKAVPRKQVTVFFDEPYKAVVAHATEKEEDVLPMPDAAASIDLSETAKRALDVLSEAINSDFYIYSADFCDRKELNKDSTGEELAKSLNFLLLEPLYNVRRQKKLQNTSHDVFRSNNIENLCDLDKTLGNSGGHGHVFCSAHPFFPWERKRKSSTKEMKITNYGDDEEVETREEEVYKVEQASLFCTCAPGHYQLRPRSKKLRYTKAVK